MPSRINISINPCEICSTHSIEECCKNVTETEHLKLLCYLKWKRGNDLMWSKCEGWRVSISIKISSSEPTLPPPPTQRHSVSGPPPLDEVREVSCCKLGVGKAKPWGFPSGYQIKKIQLPLNIHCPNEKRFKPGLLELTNPTSEASILKHSMLF